MGQPVDHHLVVTGGQLGHRWYSKLINWTEEYADKKAAGLKPPPRIKTATSQDSADWLRSTTQDRNQWCTDALDQRLYSEDHFLFQTNTHEKWYKGSDHMYNNKSRELLQNMDPGEAVKWTKYKKPKPRRPRSPVELPPREPRPAEKPPPTPPELAMALGRSQATRPELPIGWRGRNHRVKDLMKKREKLGDMVINPIPPRSMSAHVLMDDTAPKSDIEFFRTWMKTDPNARSGLTAAQDRYKNDMKQGLGGPGYWYYNAQ